MFGQGGAMKSSIRPRPTLRLFALAVLSFGLLFAADRLAQAALPGMERPPAAPTKQHALAAYGKLPLAFVANAGQFDQRVRYVGEGASFSVFFTRKEALLALEHAGKQRRAKGAALALRFLGSNPNVAIRGERPGSGSGHGEGVAGGHLLTVTFE